ncbi:MAG TPA: polysaccharide deacetylase family protein [Gemmatimonas sp.]|nr:polysaccharide deacetylase family protein [Gemmatimonas sp.]
MSRCSDRTTYHENGLVLSHHDARQPVPRHRPCRALRVAAGLLALSLTIVSCTDASAVPSSDVRESAATGATLRPASDSIAGTVATDTTASASTASASTDAGAASRTPNELGRIPIVEWHQVVDADGTYKVSRERFRAELEELHARGYVPINLSEYLDRKIDIPAGKSPVLFTFDDASPSQFSYIERGGALVVDPRSALGILEDFLRTHRDWQPKGLFCVLPAAEAGHAFFGDKGIDGQKTAWRFPKLQYLVKSGYELCNHTLWHARLDKYGEAVIQEQLARTVQAVDSAVPGYTLRGLALPYGLWPKNKALAYSGSWFDKKANKTIRYNHEAVFLVAGGPARSPYDPEFDAHKLPRVPLQGGTKLKPTLDEMDKNGAMARYVSDGNPKTVAKPVPVAAPAAPAKK